METHDIDTLIRVLHDVLTGECAMDDVEYVDAILAAYREALQRVTGGDK